MAQAPEELSFTVPDATDPASSHCITYYKWQAQAPSNLLPVLCVHGLTRNGRDFDYLARELSKTRTVLAVDMPGRGKSEYLKNPLGYTYPAYVADIAALLKHEAIAQVDWIGTSMGGIIGMLFAAMVPGVIRKLVLNDVGMLVTAASLKRIFEYMAVVPDHATRDQAEAALRLRMQPFGIQDEEHWQHVFAHSLVQRPDGRWTFAYDPNIVQQPAPDAPVQDIDFWQMWPALTPIPMLLIRGEVSDLLLKETAQQMKEKHPAFTWHDLPGIGHAPALMAGDQIKLITEWLG